MQNPRTNMTPNPRKDDLQELVERLGACRRLAAGDKPIFAKNLGDLAVRLSPDDPLEGARRIVMHSGNENLWPTKRKKFFRFPNEEAPPAGTYGDYASNPVQFQKLAEAAGELLCKSENPDTIDKWKRMSIKSLVRGTSFMPSFVPKGVTGQSAKDLLDEYAAVLAEAVKSRTKISELWEIMQSATIALETDQDYSSPYGEAAIFPQPLLKPIFRDHVKNAHFTTEPNWTGDEWSNPCLPIGYVSFPVNVRMFFIPEEKRLLFPKNPLSDRRISKEASEWLESVGFDLGEGKFPNLGVGEPNCGWKSAKANIFLKAGIAVTHDGDADPKVEIHLWGDLDYAAHNNQSTLSSNIVSMISNHGSFLHYSLEVGGYDYIEAVYDRPFSESGDQDAFVMALLPSLWQAGSNAVEWDAPSVWLDRESSDLCDEIYDNNYARGWTDDAFIARLLMSEGAEFYPIIPESDPAAGVLPSGSIGASLLQNARSASPANRITQLLIDKVTLTAEAGLRFYEAMVHDHRAAIHRI